MTRVDTSIATFFLVHHDLFVESLYGFGSADQKERLLADASSLRITGAFALTEPGHGSDVAGGMETRARRISSDRRARRRRRHLGAERCQALDRERDVLRLHAGVGQGGDRGADGPALSAGSSLMLPCRA